MTVFSFYLKVDLYGSLSGWRTDEKNPKTSRIKAKSIYFEASKYDKEGKNHEFLEVFWTVFSIM